MEQGHVILDNVVLVTWEPPTQKWAVLVTRLVQRNMLRATPVGYEVCNPLESVVFFLQEQRTAYESQLKLGPVGPVGPVDREQAKITLVPVDDSEYDDQDQIVLEEAVDGRRGEEGDGEEQVKPPRRVVIELYSVEVEDVISEVYAVEAEKGGD
ncbi:uncharacterized protein BDZ99DRAFT_459828 [Mytilinidion resinicola]|uniref:Uncharacterized protein n=1 Tax=Mytilinidion resinicola TaxID=574789 RepID=A0A6A6Z002_9PEZI|nr:uncharacterized protein BDZ99DRAFT_459828 [Mytilinidion resinicola]KAF2814108.1 hypothetical protein BDZ99DRAFT_459828 [Mytilinidion resinicola]